MQLPTIKKSKKGNLPNLIIIGAQKCATTSVHYYLGLHPRISISREKELNFFIRELNWSKGIEWYKSNFTGKARIHGESSPYYTDFPFFGGVAGRMYSVVPEVKLIYILRDPIERIISDYVTQYADELEDRTIEEALTHLDSNPYVYRSKYYMQLEQYLKYFPKSNILIITSEDLNTNRRKTMKKIFNFLNVDDAFYSTRFLSAWHKSKYKRRRKQNRLRLQGSPVMKIIKLLPFEMRGLVEKLLFLPFTRKVKRPVLDEGLRQKIIEFLQDDINRLRKHTGCDFEGWFV